ncbi:SGNH/GDSL hydrolase family protein [Yoonia sp. SS1-5]|uniref:SGNH/GDSL hydrolase family protein n=1 Tax=Yoonia rhodophyticola TaxID=3137370 RepID=A0AAN0M659_9RHOB
MIRNFWYSGFMLLKTCALGFIIVPQAAWVAARAARLPEASGERTGASGTGPALSVMTLGDSSAAGVGVEHQRDALGGRLAAELAKRFTVRWDIVAKSGGTVRSTTKILRSIPPRKIDFVLIALGVNDSKNGVSLRKWQTGYRKLLDEISDKFDAPQICASGLPPVRHFPILPRPLRTVLGDRAELFDVHLRQIVSTRANTHYIPIDFTLDTTKMARDGFHPGPEIYAQWARLASDVFETSLGDQLP